MINYCIIEDDMRTVNMIDAIISDNFPEILLSGHAKSIQDGIELISKVSPNFIFLDVNLEDGISLEILKDFPEPKFKIIFITSHSEYAIDAFKHNSLDFILKPFDPKEIISGVKQVIAHRNSEKYTERVQSFFESYSNTKERIVLSNAENIHVVALDEIIYAKSDNNYTSFYLKDGQEILISKSLKVFEEKLANTFFFRIHQRYLINTLYIKRYDKRSDEVVLGNNLSLPVAQSKKKLLLHFLKG